MAIIYSYPLGTPKLSDLVIGTSLGNGNPTKSFTIQSIADLASGVSKIIAGTDISISPSGGTGEVTINCTLDPGVTSIIAGTNIALSPSSGVGAVNVSVSGVVLDVTSGNANTITIGGTSTNPTVAANVTSTIASGGTNLATAGTIYNFVTTGVNARIQNITNPVDAQDVATKSYVDQLTAGGVTFKGGFNATTGVIDGGTDNLTTGATRVAVDVGDLYVVTTAGDFYGDATVPLAIGDQVYAQTAAVVGASVIADWITIESNIVPASAGATDGATTKGVSGFDNQMFAATADGFITSTTLNEIPITVQNVGGSNYYFVDGTQQSTITLLPDVTYLINVSDLTVNNHPFILTETSGGGSGATAYTTGVIYLVNNAPVNQTDWESSFSSTTTRKLRVTLTQTAPILYYGCAVHANMGASISQGGEVTSVTTTDGTFVNLTPDAPAVGAVTVTADLSAGGTADSTTFLRGDNEWATPPVTDNYVDGIAFDTATGVLTLDRTGSLTDLTQDLDGRYALSSDIPASITQTVTTTNGTFINLTPTSPTSGAVTVTADLSASGTPSSSNFLAGDNSWTTALTSVGLTSTASTIVIGSSPLTANGTMNVDLASSGVTPGSYTNADITIDTYGRITVAGNGTSTGGTVTSVTSADTNTITVANTTTTPEITAVTAAVASGSTALVTSGDVYSYVNTNAPGTVTSIGFDVSAYNAFSITPSTAISTNGTFTLGINGGSAGQFLDYTGNWSTPSGNISGTGTANKVPLWTTSTNLGDSVIAQDGTNIGIGTTSPSHKLDINGNVNIASGQPLRWGSGNAEIVNSTYDLLFKTYDGSAAVNEVMRLGSGKIVTLSGPLTINTTIDSILNLNSTDDGPVYAAFKRNNDRHAFFGFGSSSDQFSIFNEETSGSINIVTVGGNLLLNSNGKVGIGTSAPSTELDVSGDVTATTFLGELTGTINTATTAVTQANATNNTTVATTAYVDSMIGTIPAGLVFQGAWNASTNTPTLTSGSGTTGHFYIVSVAGSTNLDGITDWQVGDWAVFVEQGATDQWEKIDNSSVLDGAGVAGQIAYWSSTSQLAGNTNLFFDSTNDRVGIGTTSPSHLLTLEDASSPALKIKDTTQGTTLLAFSQDANSHIGTFSNHPLVFDTNSSEAMRIEAGGDVGIGTTNPTAPLHVFRNGFAQLNLESNGGTWQVGVGSGNDFALRKGTSGSNYGLWIESNLNVGIGTTSPSYKLDVDGNIRGEQYLYIKDTGGTKNLTLRRELSYGTIDNGTENLNYNASNHLFLSGFSEKMRINSSGNVGIGETSPGTKLHVSGDGALNATSTQSLLRLERPFNSGVSFAQGADIAIGRGNTYPSTQMRFILDNGTNAPANPQDTVMALDSSGNVGIGTTSPSAPLTVIDTHFNNPGVKISASSSSHQAELNLNRVDVSRAARVVYALSNTNQWFTGICRDQGGATNDYSITTTDDIGSASNPEFVIKTDGKVGIGTKSPATNLEIKSTGNTTVRLSTDNDATDKPELQLFRNIGDYASVRLVPGGGNSSGLHLTDYRDDVNSHIIFETRGENERMRIEGDGNVGIGTTTPASILHISDVNAQIRLQHTGNSYFQSISTDSSNNLKFGTGPGGAERMRIEEDGDVGIGTTTPSTKLQVSGTISSVSAIENGTAQISILNANVSPAAEQFYVGNNLADVDLGNKRGALKLFTGTSERMRINSTGQVQFNSYTSSSSFTGTAAANLAVDSSGNIITEASGGGGTISGSGTTNKIPKFTGSTAIGDSIIDQPNATDVTIANSTSDQVGIRTAFPNSALHVEGNIKTTSVNASEQGFFASGSQPAIKQGAYGKGNFFSISEDANIATMYSGYGTNGKMVEGRRAMIVRVPPNAWPRGNGSPGSSLDSIQLIPFKANSIIMDVRVSFAIAPQLASGSSWGSSGFPIKLVMFGREIPGVNQSYSVIGGIQNQVFIEFNSLYDKYRYGIMPIGVGGEINNENSGNLTGDAFMGDTNRGYGSPFWFRSKSGPPPTNPNWKQNSTSLRLMLDGTTNINTKVINDCYFYVEYVAFNYQNFENNANKSMVSVFSSSTPAASLNNRTSFYTSAKLTAQSNVCSVQTLPAVNVKKWHSGTNTFPQVGDRVVNTDSSTGYPSGTSAGNGYYYLYSAGGKRYFMRINGAAGTSNPPGTVTEMSSCTIPAPTS